MQRKQCTNCRRTRKMTPRNLLAAATATLLATWTFGMDSTKLPYPTSKTEPIVDELHGERIHDPYRWLEEGNNPDVREWTDKQNALTRSYLDQLPGRSALRERLDKLLEIGIINVPRPAKGKYFYTKREGKQNQPVLYVRDGVNGADRELLDVNQISSDGTTALDWYFPNDDGRFVAYGLSASGNEMSTLRIRDVATGKDLSDVIERTRACSVAWLPDASGFCYTRYPQPGSVPKDEETYHRRVYFHKLGDLPGNDAEKFGQDRPKEDWPNIHLSPDGKWLVIVEQQGWAKTEVFVADTTKPSLKFSPLAVNTPAVFQVDVTNSTIFVRTNDEAPRYKLRSEEHTSE